MISVAARGFTLLEVLVALVLVAATLTLGYSAVRQATRITDDLYLRVLANWAGQNEYALLVAGASTLDDEASHSEQVLLGRRFQIESRRVPASAGDSGQIRISSSARPEVIVEQFTFPL